MSVMRLTSDEIDVMLTALDLYDPTKDDLAGPEIKKIHDRLVSLLLTDGEVAIPEILIILNDEDVQATETAANEAAVIAPITEADTEEQRVCSDCGDPLPDDNTSGQCDDCFDAESEEEEDDEEDEEESGEEVVITA